MHEVKALRKCVPPLPPHSSSLVSRFYGVKLDNLTFVEENGCPETLRKAKEKYDCH